MPRTVADPASMRQLAQTISRAQTDINAAAARVRSGLQATDWQDPVRTKFEQDLNAALRNIATFNSQLDAVKQYLNKKTGQLEQYQAR